MNYLNPGISNTTNCHGEQRTRLEIGSLIGRPFLFGRFYDLPHGFEVVPIAELTLESDGKISGYDHQNEQHWIPWEDGFAILARHRYGPPSSTWRYQFCGMPIGWFCEEPEAPQKLCLVPAATRRPEITYVVASCRRFFERINPPIWQLVEQLEADGIAPENIKVVVNGCDQPEMRIFGEIEVCFSTHDAWEWSALFEAPLRWNFDYAMLLHDTSRIEAGFRNAVETINDHVNWDHLPATPLARCLLGLYSHEFLLRVNPWLRKNDRISKSNGIIAEAAGELLLQARSAMTMGPHQAEWAEQTDEFSTGSPRIRRKFPNINLHKFIHASGSPEDL